MGGTLDAILGRVVTGAKIEWDRGGWLLGGKIEWGVKAVSGAPEPPLTHL